MKIFESIWQSPRTEVRDDELGWSTCLFLSFQSRRLHTNKLWQRAGNMAIPPLTFTGGRVTGRCKKSSLIANIVRFFNALVDRATMSGMMVHRKLHHAGQGGSRSFARVPRFAPKSSEEESKLSSSKSSSSEYLNDLGYQLPNRPGTSGRTIASGARTPIQTIWKRESRPRGDLFSLCCLTIDYVTLTAIWLVPDDASMHR
jgi:hypothetical protein